MRRLQRHSIRFRGYDYRQPGAYFVTVCTHRRECLFGSVSELGQVQLNDFGLIVEEKWLKSAEIRREIALDAYVAMPHHFLRPHET
jgi:REP element-mobilizing transposase RayT